MLMVGKVELESDKDVSAGAETSLSELFPFPEREKKFTVESAITRDMTKLKITVAKLDTINTTAGTTKYKGAKTDLWLLTKYADFSKKVKASEAIKKGDMLSVVVESTEPFLPPPYQGNQVGR